MKLPAAPLKRDFRFTTTSHGGVPYVRNFLLFYSRSLSVLTLSWYCKPMNSNRYTIQILILLAGVIFLMQGCVPAKKVSHPSALPPLTKHPNCIVGDCQNGYGAHLSPDGSKYEGSWDNGLFNGKGTMSLPDGSMYFGQWKKGKKHGHGTLILPDGSKYVGAMLNDRLTGKGILYSPDGSEYDGTFKDGMFHGSGTLACNNGAEYEGEWHGSEFHGQGTYTFPDGTQYTGQWQKGKCNGQGTKFWPTGKKYSGAWKDNQLEGFGIFIFPDGYQYKGEWQAGLPDGRGIKTFPNGQRYSAVWDRDRFVEETGDASSDHFKYGNDIVQIVFALMDKNNHTYNSGHPPENCVANNKKKSHSYQIQKTASAQLEKP